MGDTVGVHKEQSLEELLSEYLKISIAQDGLTATVSREMNIEYNRSPPTIDELEAYFLNVGMLSEVNIDLLQDVHAALCDSDTILDMPIADHGRPPIDGKDEVLEWLESEMPLADTAQQPLIMADFSPVKKDQAFAKIIPPTKGIHGVDVGGNEIPAKNGKALTFIAGHGVRKADDYPAFIAEIDGRIEIVGNLVCVSRVLDIPEDAEPTAGIIEFDGMINVVGSVLDGSELRAEEGINVNGLVEDATLRAGGSIALNGGLNGGGNGLLDCKGDLSARFLNSANVMVLGNITIEREIISSVVHGQNIDIPSGSITGGKVSAIDKITVGEIGNETGIATSLAVSVDMYAERELELVQQRIKKLEGALKIIAANIDYADENVDELSPEMTDNLEYLRSSAQRFKDELNKLNKRHKELRRSNKSQGGEIIVLKVIHPGAVIRIGRYEKRITKLYEGKHRIYFDAEKYEVVVDA